MYQTVRLINLTVKFMPADDAALSRTFAALADPTRREILARLASGEATVGEIAAPFAMSLPAVSKHLKVLERAGLVVRGREAQWRPCRLDPAPIAAVEAWLAALRVEWEARLDRLEAYLVAVQAKGDGAEEETDDGDVGGEGGGGSAGGGARG